MRIGADRIRRGIKFLEETGVDSNRIRAKAAECVRRPVHFVSHAKISGQVAGSPLPKLQMEGHQLEHRALTQQLGRQAAGPLADLAVNAALDGALDADVFIS